MKEVLTSDQYKLIYPMLIAVLESQVKAIERLGPFAESDESIRRICPYDYYKGNVGFMKWLMWYLNPDKPQQCRQGKGRRRVIPSDVG